MASDREGTPLAGILNEAAARFYFGGGNPIGATVELESGRRRRVYEIVGVVGDAKHMSVRQETPHFLYNPIAQASGRLARLTLAVKTRGGPAQLAAAVEGKIRELGSDILVTEIVTLEQQVDAALVQERLLSTVGGFFGVLVLLLSAVGLYGLLAHVVGRRTSEIGIRIALGADRSAVVWMILRRSLWLVAIGVAVGIPMALMAARSLSSLLYGLGTADAVTIAGGVMAARSDCCAGCLSCRREGPPTSTL